MPCRSRQRLYWLRRRQPPRAMSTQAAERWRSSLAPSGGRRVLLPADLRVSVRWRRRGADVAARQTAPDRAQFRTDDAAAEHDAGADEVIAEEFETSVEIFTVVLHKYFVPRDKIETFISDVRADGYQMLRSSSNVPGTLPDLVRHIPEVRITARDLIENGKKRISILPDSEEKQLLSDLADYFLSRSY